MQGIGAALVVCLLAGLGRSGWACPVQTTETHCETYVEIMIQPPDSCIGVAQADCGAVATAEISYENAFSFLLTGICDMKVIGLAASQIASATAEVWTSAFAALCCGPDCESASIEASAKAYAQAMVQTIVHEAYIVISPSGIRFCYSAILQTATALAQAASQAFVEGCHTLPGTTSENWREECEKWLEQGSGSSSSSSSSSWSTSYTKSAWEILFRALREAVSYKCGEGYETYFSVL